MSVMFEIDFMYIYLSIHCPITALPSVSAATQTLNGLPVFFARAIIKTDEPLFRLTFKLTDHFELCHGGWFFKSFLACGKKGRNLNSQKKEQSVFCAVRPSVKLCKLNCEP